jgi:hypothetical protein
LCYKYGKRAVVFTYINTEVGGHEEEYITILLMTTGREGDTNKVNGRKVSTVRETDWKSVGGNWK